MVGIAAKAAIERADGKILALFRTETAPRWPNSWDLPGGVVDDGETVEDGMRREILEEAGVTVTALRIISTRIVTDPQGSPWRLYGFAARHDSGEVVLSYEHNDMRWITPEEFLSFEISPHIRIIIEAYQALSTK